MTIKDPRATENVGKIRLKVASYALLDVLKALYKSDVNEVAVTKEDGDLILVVDTSYNISCGCYVKVDENGYPDLDGSISGTDCPYELKAKGVTLHG